MDRMYRIKQIQVELPNSTLLILYILSIPVSNSSVSTQVVFHLHGAVGLLVAVLDDDRRVEREVPLAAAFGRHRARAGHDDRARGNLKRALLRAPVDFAAH